MWTDLSGHHTTTAQVSRFLYPNDLLLKANMILGYLFITWGTRDQEVLTKLTRGNSGGSLESNGLPAEYLGTS